MVTGGAGFLGACVTDKLVKLGFSVCVYDDFLHYGTILSSAQLRREAHRLSQIEDRIAMVRGNVMNLVQLRRAIAEFEPAVIIHLAAMPLAKHALLDPCEAAKSLIIGTTNVLEAAKETSAVKRICYISSSMVYGNFLQAEVDEEHPKRPLEVYGALKLAGEDLVRVLSKRYGIDFSVARPTAVYGPTDNNERVIASFLRRAMRGEPLEVRGLDAKLDFTYVTDTAEGILRIAVHPEARQQTFNISRGEARTIMEAAEIISSLVPNTRIEVRDTDLELPMRGTLDISKARQLLNFEPKISLDEGLKRYYEYLLNPHETRPW